MISSGKQLVSIIMPAHNSASYIADSINSLLSQTYNNMEIIIVDDGSTDNTAVLISGIANQSISVRYIYQKNLGPSAARNRGIKEARGEFIAFLDADDICMPDRIEQQMKALMAEPDAGLVFCRMNSMAAAKEIKGKNFIKKLLIRNYIGSASVVMVKKECFDKVGLFDETLAVAEDWDMWLRIARRFDCSYIDKPLVKMRLREGSQSYYGEKNLENELKFLKKIYSLDDFKNKKLTKIKAYSRCYYRAALAYVSNGDLKKAREYLWKSAINPFMVFEKAYAALFLRFLLGEKIFQAIKRLRKKNVLSNI